MVADAAHDLATLVVPEKEVSDSEVSRPTPEELWFCPKDGWPRVHDLPPEYREEWAEHCAKDLPHPPEVTPTKAELDDAGYAGGIYTRTAIGELRIEVLQCENLRMPFQMGRPDPYVLVMFESYAARNKCIWNHLNPRWGACTPRAFKFPVHCPFSALYVAIMDENHRTTDDGLGRVVVPLSSLRAGTTYDAWFPLQYGTLRRHVRQYGTVRLRLSLTFYDTRARLISYFKPPPQFCVPFINRAVRADCAFAHQGRFPPELYNFVVLESHIEEIKAAARSVVAVSRAFIYYRAPYLSVFVCILMQFLITYPHYAFACVPLFALAVVLRNYVFNVAQRRHHPIEQPGDVIALVHGSLRGQPEVPLEATPVAPEELDADEMESDGEEEDNGMGSIGDIAGSGGGDGDGSVSSGGGGKRAQDERHGSTYAARAASAAGNAAIRLLGIDRLANAIWSHRNGGLEGALEALQEQVEEDVEVEINGAFAPHAADGGDDDDDAAGDETKGIDAELGEGGEGAAPRRGDAARDRAVRMERSVTRARPGVIQRLNPLARYLQPVQGRLGRVVRAVRLVQRLVNWDDRFLTLALTLALLVSAIALALLGCALALLPWGLIVEWTCRLAALAAFGPHMLAIGDRAEADARRRHEESIAFEEADAAGRARILEEHYQRLYEERLARRLKEVEAEELARRADSSRNLRALDYAVLKTSVDPALTLLKHGRCRPDLTRSRAAPYHQTPSSTSRAAGTGGGDSTGGGGGGGGSGGGSGGAGALDLV